MDRRGRKGKEMRGRGKKATALVMNVTNEQSNSGRLSESHGVLPAVFSRSISCYFIQ